MPALNPDVGIVHAQEADRDGNVHTERDNEFYREWDVISRDREQFLTWMNEHVLNEVAA